VRQKIAGNVFDVASLLTRRYRDFDHYNRKNPIDELLFILCSTKTSESGYRKTFKALRSRFPTSRRLVKASLSQISDPLVRGGLAKKKATAIKATMRKLASEFGRPTLAPLRKMDDEECERFLTGLPGVGKKVAKCVMLFSLGRRVFPVDAHCWRVSRRLGFVPRSTPSRINDNAAEALESRIPAHLRFSLHVNMLSLGREFCTANDPKCDLCPLHSLCPRIGLRGSRNAMTRGEPRAKARR
jgi:endonuclease III